MRPLAQGKGTPHQSTIQQTLMAMVNVSAMAIVFAFVLIVRVASPSSKSLQEAFVSQANQSRGSLSPVSPAQWPHSATSPFLRSNLIDIDSIQISHWDPAMPPSQRETAKGSGLVHGGVTAQKKGAFRESHGDGSQEAKEQTTHASNGVRGGGHPGRRPAKPS